MHGVAQAQTQAKRELRLSELIVSDKQTEAPAEKETGVAVMQADEGSCQPEQDLPASLASAELREAGGHGGGPLGALAETPFLFLELCFLLLCLPRLRHVLTSLMAPQY